MTNYTLSIALADDVDLAVEFDDFGDVLSFYGEKLNGDPKWLISQARAAVAAAANGKSVRPSAEALIAQKLGGKVIQEDGPSDQSAPSAPTGGTSASDSAASSGQTAPRSETKDPWADENDPLPDEPQEADPWGGGSVETEQPSKPAASKPAESKPAAESSGGVKKTRDKFDREWMVGLDDAPNCNCGDPAARVKAKSQKGKWYTTWKCAKGAGSDYRDKCDFSEFPD